MSKGKVVSLKLRRRHPAKYIRLGRHKIVGKFEEYELNEKEQESLKGPGPRHWIISKEEFEKKKEKKKAKQEGSGGSSKKTSKKTSKKVVKTGSGDGSKKTTKKVAKKVAKKVVPK